MAGLFYEKKFPTNNSNVKMTIIAIIIYESMYHCIYRKLLDLQIAKSHARKLRPVCTYVFISSFDFKDLIEDTN